jgi:hypothetical protein
MSKEADDEVAGEVVALGSAVTVLVMVLVE